jgi:type IV pilus assembly protein PilX
MKAKCKNSESGMVLLVTLIMIGIMSIIAVSAIRGSSMQEAMAGNLHDRNLAFQAAEAGLRYAEEDVLANGAGYTFGDADGLYTDQNKTTSTEGSVKDWTPEQWNNNSIQLEDSDLSVELPAYPQYVIEKIGTVVDASGSPSTIYRITSRAFGLTGSSEVVVQSTYEVGSAP